MRKIIISSMFCVIIIWITYPIYEDFVNHKTFSNTDVWGIRELSFTKHITVLTKEILGTIPKIPYIDSNKDKEEDKIRKELDEIKYEISTCSNYTLNRMKEEISLDGILNRFLYTSLDKEIINNVINIHVNPLIMTIKKTFNRVRPYKLDETIIPLIDKQPSPSYPSGHAIQSYFIAFLLGEKEPLNKTHYIDSAHDISINRMISGVNYRSDIEYGKMIANKIYAFFSESNNPLL
jgi:hypothetical protein